MTNPQFYQRSPFSLLSKDFETRSCQQMNPAQDLLSLQEATRKELLESQLVKVYSDMCLC